MIADLNLVWLWRQTLAGSYTPCTAPLDLFGSYRGPRIPQAYAWAEKFESKCGVPLLDMSQGVPGVPPPRALLDALANAGGSPLSCGYLPNAGSPTLRKAVVQEMKVRYGEDADVTADDLVLTAGCNMAFCATAMTLADAGDEVILPVPW